jgi:uncharacterized membrane protein YfcA
MLLGAPGHGQVSGRRGAPPAKGETVTRAKPRRASFLSSPWLELNVLLGTVVLSYAALLIIARGSPAPAHGMAMTNIVLLLLGFFVLSFAIAVIAVMAGIGGGVIYTPLMLAFTPVNSLVVRATGLIVAMFSGLVSTGPFIKRGIGNLKVSLLSCVGYGAGGFIGARGAIAMARTAGAAGEGFLRMGLGLIVLALGVYFFLGGARREWPVVREGARVYPSLSGRYFEPSIGRAVAYEVVRAVWGVCAMFGIGLISGFFGLGGGWAIVPILNFIMALPLKVAASLSGMIIGMGGCVTVWPYLYGGAILPLFVAPWLAGQVLGGMIGAQVLIRARSEIIRVILIGIMGYTSFGLITNALQKLQLMGAVPDWLSLLALAVTLAWVVAVVLRKSLRPAATNGKPQGREVR